MATAAQMSTSVHACLALCLLLAASDALQPAFLPSASNIFAFRGCRPSGVVGAGPARCPPLARRIRMQQQQQQQQQGEEEEEKDVVEKIFSFFFGKVEAEPMGLKRFDKTRFPEQYPATKTEFADPVTGDSPEVAKLRPLLHSTQLQSRQLKLVYSATQHGWNPAAFHKKVDKLGACLMVATTADNQIVGGYNPKGWVGYGENRASLAAFLFTFPDSATMAPTDATKLCKVGGAGVAVIDEPETGPRFGADGLNILLKRDNPQLATCKLGSYYERMPGGKKTVFVSGEMRAQLKELKVFTGVYEKGEFVPFADADPFSLT